MGDIRIRVGVALDSNVRTVYKPLVAAAQEAAQNVMRALNTGAKITVQQQARTFQQMTPAIGHPYRDGAVSAEASLKALQRTAKQQADAMTKDVARAARDRVREERAAMREIERELRDHNRRVTADLEKEEANRAKLRDRFARRFSHGAVHNGMHAVGMGTRLAADLAHGAGVQMNTGAMVHDYMHRQELATALSTEGWIGAWGHADTQINGSQNKMDPKDLMQKANSIALDRGLLGGSTQVLEGIQKFLMKTGNLKQAVDMFDELAKFAKATSTSMDDALEAVGAISNQLPETMSEEQKLTAIMSTMKVLGGQGEIGALHIRQLARGGGMEKLAGAAKGFTLDKETATTLQGVGLNDSVSQNVAVMGAMAQMAMKRGMRASPQMAMNSAMAFVTDLNGATTRKRWEAQFGAGAVYSDSTHTTLADPKKLIMAALSKSQGAGDAIANLMPNRNSKAVITAFADVYKDAVKDAKAKDPTLNAKQLDKIGLEAFSKQFDKFLHVTIDEKQLDDKFNEQMKSSATKVAQFNTKLQMIADTAADKLLPALQKLEDPALRLAGAFTNFVLWATDNPGKLVATAISASIAKAAIGTTIQTAIENMLHGQHAGAGASGGGMGALGNLGAALTIASIAVTTAQIGMATIDHFYDKQSKEENERIINGVQGDIDADRALKSKSITPEEKAKLEEDLAKAKADQKAMSENGPYSQLDRFAYDMGSIGGLFSKDLQQSVDDAAKTKWESYQAEQKRTNEAIAKLETVMQQIKDHGITVEVKNPPKPDDGSSHPVPARIGGQ